jgi:hypothetical protein
MALHHVFTEEVFEREGNEMLDPGFYVDLLAGRISLLRI